MIHAEVVVEKLPDGYCPVELVAVAGQPPVEQTCEFRSKQKSKTVRVNIFFKMLRFYWYAKIM
jgi:hypothetical protein